MKPFLVFLLLPLSARAAKPAPGTPPAPVAGSPRAGAPYWFKTYSTAPYKEEWTGELTLKDFDRDLSKAVERIQKGGGKLTQPLENFVASKTFKTQQVSFTISHKRADELVDSLRQLGEIPEPARREFGNPIPLAEVRKKIDVLMKEKTEHAAALAQVPAAAAAEEEILEHLLMVEAVAKSVDTDVRFNLLIKQK